MPQFDRGVYEPSDDVRVFDGSEEDEDVEGSRLPLLIVLALLVLAMFAGVVWLAYTQGVARGRTETPVLTAQNGPARVAPQSPGGVEQPYKGFKIYEQPAPADDDSSEVAATQPVSSAPVLPKPAAMAEAPPAKPAAPAAMTAPAPAPAVVPKPVPAAPVVAASAKPAPAPATPMARPAPTPTETPAQATSAPRALAPPKTVAVPAAPASNAAAPSGGPVLQIGAFKSQADAMSAWNAYRLKHAALLAGYGPDVLQADLGDKGIWYRLRIAGFANRDVASALCDRLKTDGGGCFLGR